jgi:hypothetical protein
VRALIVSGSDRGSEQDAGYIKEQGQRTPLRAPECKAIGVALVKGFAVQGLPLHPPVLCIHVVLLELFDLIYIED